MKSTLLRRFFQTAQITIAQPVEWWILFLQTSVPSLPGAKRSKYDLWSFSAHFIMAVAKAREQILKTGGTAMCSTVPSGLSHTSWSWGESLKSLNKRGNQNPVWRSLPWEQYRIDRHELYFTTAEWQRLKIVRRQLAPCLIHNVAEEFIYLW